MIQIQFACQLIAVAFVILNLVVDLQRSIEKPTEDERTKCLWGSMSLDIALAVVLYGAGCFTLLFGRMR